MTRGGLTQLFRAFVSAAILTVTAPASFAATFTVTTNASSGAGSLRQAMIEANASPGLDTIVFAIGSGPQTIDISAPYPLPAINDPVVIDATTQPGYVDAPTIRLVQNAERYDVTLNVGGSTIRGLKFDGPGYLRLTIYGNGGNRLAGNEFNGYWVFVRGDANTIGGTAAGDGNLFHMGLWLENSSRNIVQGNTFLSPWVGYGIKVVGGTRNQIGGTGPGAGNTVRSCSNLGIDIAGDGNVVEGNIVSDNGNGIRVDHTGNRIGGLEPGAGNVITRNGGSGVLILEAGNAILSNSIYGNGDPAIDLTIANAARTRVCAILHNAGTTRVSGELYGASGETYRIQLFANATACDAETYLGEGMATVDADGQTDWQFDVAATTSNIIGATATDGTNTTSEVSPCTVTCRRIPTDFNGDGRSDLFWRNPQTGQNTIWFMSGRSIIDGYDLPDVPASYSLYFGDFNGDGRTDLYWWNPTARDGTVWLMNGRSFTGAGDGLNRSTKGPGWELLVGDFTGDGRADLFWRELATGYQELWAGLPFVLTGRAPQVSSTPGWERRAAQVGGSPADDVMWRFPSDGQGSFWFMNGAVPEGGANLWPVGADWTPSLADVNGDHLADILWRHNTTGELTFWFMDGGKIIGGGGMFVDVRAPRLLYRGDFNGDGKIDILWRNPPDGENAMWFLDGRKIIGGGNAPPVTAAGWELVGQR